jgi:forespore regulator of the sigma-K checkpoint
VSIFKLKRRLKNRWRRWRRIVWTFSICAVIFGMACLGMPLSEQFKHLLSNNEPITQETLAHLQEWSGEHEAGDFRIQLTNSNKTRIVHTGTVYVCDSETVIAGIMRPDEILAMLDKHPRWEGRIDGAGEVWLEEHVPELSATCKENGYFGLDSNGSLSLFEGKPDKEKVIRTFFQINIKSMESALPREVIDQLHSGIRVQDLEEYNSVISTFSDYALGPAEATLH